ncbi:DUF3094 family protein [Teredinibacter purpureus]|uniref:DUF3094 family protein n=1 Tax=Teredinibacter purpureus TaxID=2731756 RepID=UPI0005F85DB4|nr:DUF3094 family protein [Teredinibacter purpureus]
MPELYPDDQKKVDAYLASNVNAVERKEFKPLRLLGIIFVCLGAITLVSYLIAIGHGVI